MKNEVSRIFPKNIESGAVFHADSKSLIKRDIFSTEPVKMTVFDTLPLL